jgi:hypothetical protein
MSISSLDIYARIAWLFGLWISRTSCDIVAVWFHLWIRVIYAISPCMFAMLIIWTREGEVEWTISRIPEKRSADSIQVWNKAFPFYWMLVFSARTGRGKVLQLWTTEMPLTECWENDFYCFPYLLCSFYWEPSYLVPPLSHPSSILSLRSVDLEHLSILLVRSAAGSRAFSRSTHLE